MEQRPHFRIAGIPVRIDWSFWLLAVLLGYQARTGWLLVAWVVVVLVSILVHELGHAVVLRAYHQQPNVTLYAMGGVTVGSAPNRTRAESIIVSLAGPLTALLLLGIPAYLLSQGAWANETYERYVVVHDLAWVNIAWSIFNLMPVLPLDGGNIAASLMGRRRAQIVSVVVAFAGAVWFFQNQQQFGGFLAMMFAIMNFAGLQSGRSPAPASPRPSPARGRPRLADVPSTPRQLPVGDLASAWMAQPPSDLGVAASVAQSGQALPLATELLRSGPAGPGAAATLQSHLHYAGYHAESAAVGQMIYTDGRWNRAQTAFDVACSLARSGNPGAALMWLDRSIDDGFHAPALLDGEPDLGPVRALPGWSTLRARVT